MIRRVWKPLDCGGKRLYSVTHQYYTGDGRQAYGNSEVPQLVMADSPRNAASLIHAIYNQPGQSLRVECRGHAVKILMPESWWIDGIPTDADKEVAHSSPTLR